MSKNLASRRDFLKTSTQTATLVGVAGACSSCALFNKNDIQVEAKPEATELELSYERHPALREPDGFVTIEARDGDLRLVVLRRPGGELVALSMVCTHWGCDVDWDKSAARFDCPCHGSKFDAMGQVLEGPADEPLATYPVTESDTGVTVLLQPS
jgi:cytochrome b6-f complex iron-sulfur subunit